MAPRVVPVGEQVTALTMRHRRVATAGTSKVYDMLSGVSCERPPDVSRNVAERRAVDLDPSGVEAIERIGPEIGITASGEVTVDGEAVIDADCGGQVIAALSAPPRVLAVCRRGEVRLAGPGFAQIIHLYFGERAGDVATIAPRVALGERVPCINHGCVDLITGQGFEQKHVVWSTDRVVVLADDAGLRVLHLPAYVPGQPPGETRAVTVALPRVVQTVTLDAVTGTRQVGAAPLLPRFVDAAGRWLLYGRHVVDVQDGVQVTTLADGAYAIDETGRVLMRTSPVRGPLRWVRPP
jgi:hypothetical protein